MAATAAPLILLVAQKIDFVKIDQKIETKGDHTQRQEAISICGKDDAAFDVIVCCCGSL